MKGKIYTVKMVKHWTRLLKEVVEPPYAEMFRTPLALINLV